MTMRVFINRLPIDAAWGGGNNWVIAFNDYAKEFGIEVIHDLRSAQPDAILVAGFDAGNSGIDFFRAMNYCASSKTKLIVRINENDARKGTTGVDNTMWSMINLSHGSVFVSHWLQSYYAQKFKTPPNSQCAIIFNGVNKNHFRSQPKINNGKINLVTHHWSDNHLKGSDIYEKLDEFVGINSEEYTFTYIGRHKCNFKYTSVIEPLFGEALGTELGRYDVYISGSRFDPGPNHVAESISCQLPTYVHKDGGGSCEFAGSDHTFKDFDELKAILMDRQFKSNSNLFGDWRTCIGHYVDFIKRC